MHTHTHTHCNAHARARVQALREHMDPQLRSLQTAAHAAATAVIILFVLNMFVASNNGQLVTTRKQETRGHVHACGAVK